MLQGQISKSDWDFDHQVQFQQIKLSKNTYSIKVISNDKTHFNQLSTFLIRHSYKICGQYDFELTVLSGIEGIDDRKISPSYIQPSLSANLVCPNK